MSIYYLYFYNKLLLSSYNLIFHYGCVQQPDQQTPENLASNCEPMQASSSTSLTMDNNEGLNNGKKEVYANHSPFQYIEGTIHLFMHLTIARHLLHNRCCSQHYVNIHSVMWLCLNERHTLELNTEDL